MKDFKKDIAPEERASMTEKVMSYLNTDLVCYFTDHPPELRQKQEEAWQPILQWFENKFGVALKTTDTIQALSQEEDAHSKVLEHVKSLKDDRFGILHMVTNTCGSLVLALMFAEQDLTAEETFNACHVEEHYHAEIYDEEKYGPDPMQEKNDKQMMQNLTEAEKYLRIKAL